MNSIVNNIKVDGVQHYDGSYMGDLDLANQQADLEDFSNEQADVMDKFLSNTAVGQGS